MHKMSRFYFFIISNLLFLAPISAQTISNVVAKQVGNTAVITYDLQCEDGVDISLFFSDDGGNTFKGPLKKVTGDVGSNITKGNRSITWNTLQEQESLVGDQIVFRVKGATTDGIFTDNRDGKKYKTVKIGKQIFLAENLSYRPTSGSYWAYGDNMSNAQKYGYLYDWETAKNVCPSGWHLPTDEEWNAMITFLGGDKTAGIKLKEKGSTYWPQNSDATNESGFTALPGGYRFRAFYSIDHAGYWWSSSERNPTSAWCRYLVYNFPNFYRDYSTKSNGCSVRCVKD